MALPDDSSQKVSVRQVTRDAARDDDDLLAVEEPMEIRVEYGPDGKRMARSLSVTMRTPGHDFELAVGFLFTEGMLERAEQVRDVEFCGPPAPGRATSNIVRVALDPSVELDLERVQRNFYTTSSCGICGKASLDALQVPSLRPLDPGRPRVRAEVVHGLPAALRARQALFERTGGNHASGLFDTEGRLLDLREDVGRHNAVDKLLGRRFLDGAVPVADDLMVVSGRASFEILQKALVAGVPMVVAVGAPSSLAVDMARRFGMTLVGFAAPERYNIYSVPERMI